MRKKFKIMIPADHSYVGGEKAKPYIAPAGHMIVMNTGGVIFVVNMDSYYMSIKKLSDVLPKYDIVWK
tara:strand:+ start:108 stop:311 length:204 start_codon:yes stop_codon:yes gene_type:complete